MPSTFLGLQIGVSSLETSQLGVQTTGHNIANANTSGYSREKLTTATANSLETYTDHVTYLGQGVAAKGQTRVDDVDVDSEYRTNKSQQSYWSTKDTEIQSLTQVFNEPTGSTLRQAIDNFFTNGWNALAQTPSNSAARPEVTQAALDMTQAFATTSAALTDSQTRYSSELTAQVQQVNSLATNITNLNVQIEAAQARGDAPNDLLDQRDALLDKLSSFAAAQVTYTPDANNPSVVHMQVSLKQDSGASPALKPLVDDTNPPNQISVTNVPSLLSGSGTLRSTSDMVGYVTNLQGQLDTLANKIASEVNAQQQKGYDAYGNLGTAMFSGATASTLTVNSSFISDPNLLAAASSPTAADGTPNSTDGSNAQAVAQLLQTQGYDAQYAGTVTQLGTDGQAAHQQTQTFQALTSQASQLKQSVSGVDINEEMSNMIQFQQSYNAAAKFISVFNDMLTTLVQNV